MEWVTKIYIQKYRVGWFVVVVVVFYNIINQRFKSSCLIFHNHANHEQFKVVFGKKSSCCRLFWSLNHCKYPLQVIHTWWKIASFESTWSPLSFFSRIFSLIFFFFFFKCKYFLRDFYCMIETVNTLHLGIVTNVLALKGVNVVRNGEGLI